jgi:UDP-2,4-diacetamido-2,4,6-trideoxy-beta-L-altropyranose hydrolase
LSSSPLHVAFRVDASLAIGTGHFMRCLTLADALAKRGAPARFICRQVPAALRELAARRGHEVVLLPTGSSKASGDLPHSAWLGCSQPDDVRDTLDALGSGKLDWLVVDHYALDSRWETKLRKAARRILAIDDLADRKHDCDLLLDQNLYAAAHARYTGKLPPHCCSLIGPRYALLREEFARLHDEAVPRSGRVRRLLISFGGVDADNLTAMAIEAVAAVGGQQADVVIGAQHPRRAAIEARCRDLGFTCHVQTERMAEVMAAADLAIGSGSSSTWERCAVGLPTVTFAVAENQRRLVEDAAREGLVYAPGTADSDALTAHLHALFDNAGLRQALSHNGLQMVDGRGVKRVLRAMGVREVTVREATLKDSAKVFRWRNHPTIRAVSRDTAPIPRAHHEKWFARVIGDREGGLLIGEYRGSEIGVVRFDVHDGAAEVSIYLAPGAGAEGSGPELLLAAESWLARSRRKVGAIRATVLRDNERSRGLFEACGYRLAATTHEKVPSQ